MNAKHLKSLRKALSYHPAQPREHLTRTVKTVAIPTDKLDEKGNAIMRFESRVNTTNTGLRKTYRDLKRKIGKGIV